MAIIRTDYAFKSTSKEDVDVFYSVWKNEKKKPIGVVQITHGIAEGIDRYDEMARYLAEAGYAVCGQDHLGHANTAGLNHVLIVPSDAGKAMIEDMHKLYTIMHKEYKKVPYYLYGHSMGSTMARTYLGKYGKDIEAAIICGTGDAPKYAFLLEKPLSILGKLLGFNYKKEMEAADELPLPVVDPDKKLGLTDSIMNFWLSYDKENIRKYVNNPLYGMNEHAASYMCKASAVLMDAGRKSIIKKTPKDLPIFLISGDKDPVGLWGRGVKSVYKKLTDTDHDVELKLYKARHEIHNEPKIKEEVFADILNFLNKHNKNA